jgi:predicted nucleic acid-binding protein
MTRRIFVDTSGFYALLTKTDSMHAKAANIFQNAQKQKTSFVTTDYVLDESATLLRARGLGHLISRFFSIVLETAVCEIEWMDPERFSETLVFFSKHNDQEWSFTDCFSFIVMQQFRISDALTKDGHFRAAGFIPLLS